MSVFVCLLHWFSNGWMKPSLPGNKKQAGNKIYSIQNVLWGTENTITCMSAIKTQQREKFWISFSEELSCNVFFYRPEVLLWSSHWIRVYSFQRCCWIQIHFKNGGKKLSRISSSGESFSISSISAVTQLQKRCSCITYIYYLFKLNGLEHYQSYWNFPGCWCIITECIFD